MKKISLLFIILLPALLMHGQMTFEIGGTKTQSNRTALNFAFTYIKSLDSLLDLQDNVIVGKNSAFLITPHIEFQTGTDDAYSGFRGMITGLLMTFPTTTIGGLKTPDATKVWQTFPISIGAEASNFFKVVNAVGEIGWEPWYQSETGKAGAVLRTTQIGIYLQGGYKFRSDTITTGSVKGTADESLEPVKSGLLRARGNFSIDTRTLFKIQGMEVGLVGSADGWYDILNGKFYHKLVGRARLMLTDNKFFDFIYQKGSGAPNFNEGEQMGIGLILKL